MAQLQVTLEPFTGGGSSGSGGGGSLGSGGGFASASPMPHLQREQSLLNQLSGVQWNTPLPSPMDTSSADYPAASPSASPSGGSSGKSKSDGKSGDKDKDKTDISSTAAAVAAIQSSVSKDPKYLENFLTSLAHLPEFASDRIGRIKGMEKAILMKSAALKEASAFHVQMIHLKLTPSKKDDSASASGGGSGNMSSPAFGAQSQSGGGSGNMQRNASGSSPSLSSNSNLYGGSNNQSSGPGSNLPPLPHPSPLPLPLPYSLTPALVQPLPTENLLNNLTYLLVGPVLHANAMLHGHPSLSGTGSAGAGGDQNNNTAPAASASASSLSNLSRADLGILPMNLAPSALAPLGKKASTSAAAVAAAQHPFASIPSSQELLATSVTPILVDPPRPDLSNDLLDFRRRFPIPSEYNLDAGEKIMRDHIACIHEWSKAKNAIVTEVQEQVDALQKRVDAVVKKYEGKLRRGHFEVPATPIDRRRGPGATAVSATGAAATAAASSAATTAAGGSSAAASAGPSADSRKRSHASLVQELECREIQYQLQHELKSEIEKQSANALASANAGGAGSTVGAVGAANMGNMMVEANEPVYCTCKKVSFGAMVACDNEDCPTEWFHFACVGLDTKPRGKWLCADCRKKKKAKTAAAAGK